MKKTFAYVCFLLIFALAAGGCATATPQPIQSLDLITPPPASSPSAPADTIGAEGDENTGEAPAPMTVVCTVPQGFELSEEESTGAMNVYLSDVARIQYGYEPDLDGSTPDEIKGAILEKLPDETDADTFQLDSATEETFGSYPGFVIKWTTGENEDALVHEAHFILTDGYVYRVEYAVSADSAEAQASKIEAFFNSVQLTDSVG